MQDIIPAPPLVAPPSSSPPRASSSSSPQAAAAAHYPYRNNARESELEQLRQRGLAKLLNKHFTSVTRSIAEERAAAEAALRDLEQRKNNNNNQAKEWSFSDNNNELSVYDKMYLELQQKKAECKRKEKETLLLYQRYVAKFGGDIAGVAQVQQQVMANTSHNNNDNDNAERYVPRDNNTPTAPAVESSRVPMLASQIEDTISKHVSMGAERHPSIQSLGVEQTYQQVFSEMDEKQRIDYLRRLEDKGVDAKVRTPVVVERKSEQTTERTGARVGFPDMTPQYTFKSPVMGGSSNNNKRWNTDTPVSQLTATTTGTGSPPAANYDVFHNNDEDSDDDEIKSGTISELTSVHSLIMSDAEARLTQFLKMETEAIKMMLDEEVEEEMTIMGGGATVKSTYSSEVGSASARAADQAEDMVYQMQQILANFQQEQTETTAVIDSREPRPYESNNPNEEWTVYFDETYQREYYHERHSNKTQWTPPPPPKGYDDETSVRVADYTSPRSARNAAPLSHLEVMPERAQKNLFGDSSGQRVSRREEYRRLRRKRRRQRRFLLALLSLLFVGAGYYVTQYHSDAVQLYTTMGIQSIESGLAYVWDKDKAASFVAKIKSHLPDSVTAQADVKTKVMNNTKELQMKQAVVREKKAKEEAQRKALEEAEQMAREEAERVAKEEDVKRDEAEKAAAYRKARWDKTVKAMLEVMLQAPRPV